MSGREQSHKGWLQRAIGNLGVGFIDAPQRATLPFLNKLDSLTQLQRLAMLWVLGSAALALATLVCFQLGLGFATTVSVFLIVIVLLSLLDSFISSAIFSVIAISSLNFFFVEPRYTFWVGDPQDLTALAAFLITSLAITSLIRRVRSLGLAEARTRHAETQLRAAINAIPVVVWSTLPNGENDFHNERLLSYAGFSAERAQGTGWMEMIHPDDVGRHAKAWKNALATGTSFECESRLRRSDGEYRWFLARAEPLRDASGNIIKWYGTNVDIDDRKRADQALRRSEAYLAEAQKLSKTGSFGWNVATREIVWSEETFRIFGYEPTTKPSIAMVLQRVHPDDAARVRQVTDRAASNKQDFDFEHRLLMPDGSVKHLHVVAHVASNGSSSLHFVGAVMDLTAQKNAYAALEQSEQRYRHLFSHMPIALWQLDARRLVELFKGLRAEGVTDLGTYFDAHPDFLQSCMEALIIEEVNERTIQSLGGRDSRDFAGRSVAHCWQDNPDTFRRAMESRFRGETSFEEETKMTTLDGRTVDVLFTASRVESTGDLGISLVGIVDISQRIRAQEMLNRVQADFAHAARVSVLGELTASIAHEVNQPLAAIAANGEAGLRWLGRPEPDIPELRELTESIVADARRAAEIIARIRGMAARNAPEQTLLSLDDVIREALLFLRHEVQARSVAVLHHVAPDAPHVLGDRTQLQQVIVNLAVNSMQAMTQTKSTKRQITIRTVLADPATLRCIVEDTGPGIKPEHFEQLFESFFTTKQGGMGIGLPICRSIIEAHGGRVTADNDGAEGGARFSFTLPAALNPHR
jgi:PAS domain S-box-containing protein